MSENSDSGSVSSNSMETIKSNAIIKYDSLSSNRSKFWRLSEQTNLKTPPDNWLCGRFGDYNWSYPLQNHNSSMLSSFRMANSFPECVGSVDVIADSDCIKKLLLMPFDCSHISFMVHRIGNSLLIDEFDLANHLIRNESQQWSWLKRFIDDMIVPTNCKSLIAKKPITRDELQMKNMLCKFLHYSVDQNQTEKSADAEENLQLSPKKCSKPEAECPKSEENENKEFYFSHYNNESKMSEMVSRKLDQIEDRLGSQIPGPVRNVLWTFEDIRMLVASNMPIFGDSNHPAVSLRLHDMKKPINVLTGLDYWLDNLMSSVPEVVMCYHLDGIVEKYELIKTEEIPQMSGKKLFSPKVIRNIAQNILSFLKSKATKTGHTYWLFKGKHDDVVKLYDLTALCAEYMEDDTNPFGIPVAMLLYRLAKNMRDSNRSKHSKAVNIRIHKLLTNCLSLLDHKKHSQIISSANYLLSDVYVPNDIDPTFLPLNYNNNTEEEDFDDFDSSESSDDSSSCPTLEVNKLDVPHYYKKDKQTKQTNSELDDENDLDWNTRCDRALKHIIEGLNCLYESNVQKSEDILYNTSNITTEESQKMANPSKPIPLNYSSINHKSADVQKGSKSGKELTQIKPQALPHWKTCLEVCLLQKGAQVFCILAELANSKTNCRKALKYIRMGVICYEMALIIIEKSGQTNYYKEPIACLLALCGDIHIKILSSSTSEESDNDNNGSIELYCNQMIEILEKYSETELNEEFRWAYNPIISSEKDIEQRLKLCYRCYEEALYQLSDIKDKNVLNGENALHERILKRLGYICNELANHYMNESLKHFNQSVSNNNSNEQKLNETEVNRLDSLTKKSSAYFEKAIELFRKIRDKENLSLMLSNMGRLMRTSAHIFAPTFRQNNLSKEFSSKEKHFYLKAIECYNSALTELGVKGNTKYPNAWHNINWELCTTLYTVGCLMQEFAPLSTSAFEVIEEEITKYFTQALNLCQKGEKCDTSRHVLYQFRAATIGHRLGSLYHNSYRNMSEESDRMKKIFTLADSYYESSRLMYKVLNDREEYLRVTLEQIGLHERNLSQLNGFGSKLKAINLILNILITITEFDFKDIETDEEKQKIENLLELFETRIIFAIKGMIKCLSTKTSKYKDLINKWKQIEEKIENIISLKDIPIYVKIDKIYNQLISSQLIETSKSNK